MSRPARALLNKSALLNNFESVRRNAPHARVMAVVKANAYGHGLRWVAQTLAKADAFGVASVEEGVYLREQRITQPVCLLEGFFHPDELPLIAQHQLSMVLHHKSQLWDIEHARGVSPIDVWLKLDTGMHRLGFPPEQTDEMLNRLKVCLSVGQVRLMTHLANADNKFDSTTTEQVARFSKAASQHRLERSVANSAGIMSWPSTHMDWVRPGIMLYGGSPVTGVPASDLALQPVMTLASEIIAVNERRAGETIGYGGDWTCPQDMPVGVVAIGYGDGYPRHAPPGTPVLVNGIQVPLIGRVSMDMITVDLRNYPEAKIGDPVILWGHGLPVDDIAERAGTISYELLCHVAARVPRVETSG